MVGTAQVGGHTALHRHFSAQLGKAQAAQDGDDAADDPAQKCRALGHVGALQDVAAQVIDTGADGHAGHQTDAAENADLLPQFSFLFLTHCFHSF